MIYSRTHFHDLFTHTHSFSLGAGKNKLFPESGHFFEVQPPPSQRLVHLDDQITTYRSLRSLVRFYLDLFVVFSWSLPFGEQCAACEELFSRCRQLLGESDLNVFRSFAVSFPVDDNNLSHGHFALLSIVNSKPRSLFAPRSPCSPVTHVWVCSLGDFGSIVFSVDAKLCFEFDIVPRFVSAGQERLFRF